MSILDHFISPVPKPLRHSVKKLQQSKECSTRQAQDEYLSSTPFSSWPEVQHYLQTLEQDAPSVGVIVSGEAPNQTDWLIGHELLTNAFVVAPQSARKTHVLIEQATTASAWLKHLPLQTLVVGQYVPKQSYRFVFETSGRYAFWMAQWGKAAELIEDGPEYEMLSQLAAWHYYLDSNIQLSSLSRECERDIIEHSKTTEEGDPFFAETSAMFLKIYDVYELLLSRYHEQYQPLHEHAQTIELQALTEELHPTALMLTAQDVLGLAMAVSLTTVLLQISFTTFTRPYALSLQERQERGVQSFVFETNYMNMAMEMMLGYSASQCRGIGIGLVFLTPNVLKPDDLVYIQANTRIRLKTLNSRAMIAIPKEVKSTESTNSYRLEEHHLYLHPKGV